MRFQEANKLVDNLKGEIGDALETTTIINIGSGQAIVRYQTNERNCLLISKAVKFILESVKKADFNRLGNYISINLENGIQDFIIFADNFTWQIRINTNKFSLGIFMNMYLPELIQRFKNTL